MKVQCYLVFILINTNFENKMEKLLLIPAN